MNWLLIVSVGLLVGLWLRWRYKNRKMIQLANKFHGPPTLPFIGNALQFMCKPEELSNIVQGLIREYGDVFRFWLGPDLNIVVSELNDLKTLLTNSKVNFKGPQYKYMADVLGGGILSGSGPTWRRHRKLAKPNYGKRAIESYSNTFNKEVDLLMLNLRSKDDKQFNIYDDVVRSTSYTICQTLMGLTKDQTLAIPHIHNLIKEAPRMYDIVFDRMTKWYLQIDPIFWMTSSYREQNHFIKIMSEFSLKIVEHRMERLKTIEIKNKNDLMNSDLDDEKNTELSVIDRFILSKELSTEELIQETFTVFTSSQEASAKISSAILLMMAYHPECQDKLYAEIKSVLGEEDRWVTDDDFKRMPYLDMVFKEALRLYPIGAMIQRTVVNDVAISSGTVPAGSSLVVPIYQIHRDPRYWTYPDKFDPERFNADNTMKRHPNCYIPFSLGPMDCLGRHFGTKLIKTICVKVLKEFKLTSTNKYEDLRLTIAISASSMDGFYLQLQPRSQNKKLLRSGK